VQILAAPKNLQNGIRQGFYKLGKYLVKTASDGIIKSPKIGNRYYYSGHERRGKKGFWTKSGAVGAYPANQTGFLRRSLGFNVIGNRKMEFGLKAKYAQYVEKARPALKLTVLNDLAHQYKIMRDASNIM